MVAITLMGRDFDVAPYKIGALRKAAPVIGRLSALMDAEDKMQASFDGVGCMLEFLSIGLVKVDPTLTPSALEDMVGVEDIPDLLKAIKAVFAASGLGGDDEGEAQAPSA